MKKIIHILNDDNNNNNDNECVQLVIHNDKNDKNELTDNIINLAFATKEHNSRTDRWRKKGICPVNCDYLCEYCVHDYLNKHYIHEEFKVFKY